MPYSHHLSSKHILTTIVLLIVAAGFRYLEQQTNKTVLPISATPVITSSIAAANPTPVLPPLPVLGASSCHARGVLPDPICTPGSATPNVTQNNLNETICNPAGYTKAIRPPVTYTNKLKALQMTAYGFTDSISLHEEDHLISLQLGGDPSDPKNLWPEPIASPNPKDKVEDTLHTAVCNGRISLIDAQTRIATDWTTATVGL